MKKPDSRPFHEIVEEIIKSVPEEEWNKMDLVKSLESILRKLHSKKADFRSEAVAVIKFLKGKI